MQWKKIIKIFRTFLNLTQAKFGELVGAGVTAACVSCWELGKRTPSYSSQAEISKLAENTGVDLHLLPRKEEEILSKEEELKTIDIKAFREELGMSQTEFASRLGVNHSTVSKWESGERSPGRESRRRLEAVLFTSRAKRCVLALREDIDFDELKDVKSSKGSDTKESSGEFKDVNPSEESDEFKDVKSSEEGNTQGKSDEFKDVKSGNPDDDSAEEENTDEGENCDDSQASTEESDHSSDSEKEKDAEDAEEDNRHGCPTGKKSEDAEDAEDADHEASESSDEDKEDSDLSSPSEETDENCDDSSEETTEGKDHSGGTSEETEDENCDEEKEDADELRDEAEEAEDAEDCDEEKEDAEKEEDCEEDSEPEEEAKKEDEKEEENDEEKESPYNVGGANFTEPKSERPNVHDFLPEPNIRKVGGGIDILYLSLYVELMEELLNQFRNAKASALSRAELSGGKAEIPIDVGEKTFVLKSYDSQRYAYFLKNGDTFIKVAEENTDSYPSVYVQLESLFILENGADEAHDEVRDFVSENFGEIEGEKVSRVEMYCDIAGAELFPSDLDKFVCKAKHKEVLYDGKKFTGFLFGNRDMIQAKIYLKTEEIKVHHKEYMTEIWEDIEEDEEVWRVEFSLSRSALREFDVEDYDSFKEVSGDIWKYLTEKWLSMRELDNENTTRRTLTEFWEEVKEAEEFFGPLSGKVREKKRTSDKEQLLSQIFGCLSSLSAIRKKEGKEHSLVEVINYVIRKFYNRLSMQNGSLQLEFPFIVFSEIVSKKAAEYS